MIATAESAPPQTAPRTESILRFVRRTDAFRELIPSDAALGWPAVNAVRGAVFLRTPVFVQRAHAGRLELYPPFATLTLSWEPVGIAAYLDLRADDTWTGGTSGSVGTFPHSGVGDSEQEYLAMRRELFARYDELCVALHAGEQPSEATETELSRMLCVLVEPSLKPYYRQLEPAFFGRYLARPHSDSAKPAAATLDPLAAAAKAGRPSALPPRPKEAAVVSPAVVDAPHVSEELGLLISEAEELVDMSSSDSAAVDLRAITERRLRTRGVVAVTGSMKSGRSTVVNTLLGATLVPTDVAASTACLIRLVPDVETKVTVGSSQFAASAIEQAWPALQSPDGSSTGTDEVIFGVDSDWLRDVDLEVLDMPGLDTPGGVLAERQALDADLALMTVAALNPIDMGERAFLEQATAHGLPVLVAITQLDRVDENERDDLVRVISDRCVAFEAVEGVYRPGGFAGRPSTDELREALAPLLAHNTRRLRRIRQTLLSLQLVCDDLVHVGEEFVAAASVDAAERRRQREAARLRFDALSLEWDRLAVEVERKQSIFCQNAQAWFDGERSATEDRLVYELAHAPNPKSWWEQDLPYRLRQELMVTVEKAEQSLRVAIDEVLRWLVGRVAEASGSSEQFTSPGAGSDKDPGALKLRALELRDVDRIRERALAGAAAIYLLLLTPVAMVLAGVGGEVLRKHAVARQRELIIPELGQALNELYGQLREAFISEAKIAYGTVIAQLRERHEGWQQERIRALERADQGKAGDEGEHLRAAAERLKDRLETKLREGGSAR